MLAPVVLTAGLSLLTFVAPPGNAAGEGAEQTVFVGVLPVQSKQEMPPSRKEMVESTVAAQFEDPALIILSAQRTSQALANLGSSCGSASQCQVALATALEAQYLVKVQVDEPKTSDFLVRVELIDGSNGEVVKNFEDTCEICSEADLKRLSQEQALDLQNALLRMLRGEEEEEEKDPEPVVITPPPKPEKVVVVEREPMPPVVSAGWALVGVGSAATAGGVVLMALTGQSAGCPDDPRGGPCIPIVYRTVLPGAVVGGVGLVALGAGIGMVVAGKKKQKKKGKNASADTTPKVGVGWGTFTLSGRF